ncbi:MAG: DNA adenine methylase [Firmicutes bacterium]|nr:DNA adenine methylase [Bacillota bacterium]
MCKSVAKPFLKWAGGKSQLLDKLNGLYPDELINGKMDVYIEPFVGGGAVLFDVLQKFDIKKAVIIDLNKELINCYRCIKTDVSEMLKQLQALQEQFYALTFDEQSNFYLDVRKKYNAIRLNGHFDYEKAADFIFLNKTCFNGLYRVNSKGGFNVPFGKYKNPLICDKDNLILIHNLLQKVTICHGDYRQCEAYVKGKTFVYFDPPYRPITATQSFVGYSKNGFDDNNQKELAEFVRVLKALGAKVLLSNSDPKNSNPHDNFFDDLYNGFTIERINAKRMINCQADKRGDITEIIVRNY